MQEPPDDASVLDAEAERAIPFGVPGASQFRTRETSERLARRSADARLGGPVVRARRARTLASPCAAGAVALPVGLRARSERRPALADSICARRIWTVMISSGSMPWREAALGVELGQDSVLDGVGAI